MGQDPRAVFQQLAMQKDLVESNLQVLQQQIERIQMLLNDYDSGLSFLKEVMKREKDEQVLMNVGGNIFIEVKIVNPEKVTRAIGSDISIVQNTQAAHDSIESSIKSLRNQEKKIKEEYQKYLGYQSQLESQLQQIASMLQRGEA
ncbi:MAG: Prefoldin subunit alpha [Candidatus Thorarchaeota archaeon]|nr:MAG: Prefoldin subunit alpha [Candidatus Thorarchaeota archaeon]